MIETSTRKVNSCLWACETKDSCHREAALCIFVAEGTSEAFEPGGEFPLSSLGSRGLLLKSLASDQTSFSGLPKSGGLYRYHRDVHRAFSQGSRQLLDYARHRRPRDPPKVVRLGFLPRSVWNKQTRIGGVFRGGRPKTCGFGTLGGIPLKPLAPPCNAPAAPKPALLPLPPPKTLPLPDQKPSFLLFCPWANPAAEAASVHKEKRSCFGYGTQG